MLRQRHRGGGANDPMLLPLTTSDTMINPRNNNGIILPGRTIRTVRRRKRKKQSGWSDRTTALVILLIIAMILFFLILVLKSKRPKSSISSRIPIQCSDGSTGYLDDDYCDCSDGRDEPNTSACSDRTVGKAVFHCRGDDNPPIIIMASRVLDGIKDCPDGSDEERHQPIYTHSPPSAQ
jgi:hypothetical protein